MIVRVAASSGNSTAYIIGVLPDPSGGNGGEFSSPIVSISLKIGERRDSKDLYVINRVPSQL
jgi:hypothetical protein